VSERILFLDFDGVLNCATWFAVTSKTQYRKARGKAKADLKAQARDAALRAIDPAAVMLVDQILERSGADVCVSSTWRINWTEDELTLMLRERGFCGEIVGRTPNHGHRRDLDNTNRRGSEIQAWLDENHAESFCILDDSDDMGHLLPRLVRTEWLFGLQPAHVDQCVDLLTEKR
jgi:hypothetical protein